MKKLKKYYKIHNILTGEEIIENGNKEANHINTLSLKISYDYKQLKKRFTKSYLRKHLPVSIKYRGLYPFKNNQRLICLGEGNTPLYKSQKISRKLGVQNLYFKHEGFNPTGAFKDRGSLVEISKAREYKAVAVVVASTGNMAASVSAYCARADLPCFVFVPENTPNAKLAQSLFYGAKIIKIEGNYDQAAILAKKTSQVFNLFLAGDYAFRLEGQKSQAYEIIERLSFQSPDYVFVPVGNGTNIYAIWKGFNDFYKMGIINKLPKMVAVQVDSFNAVSLAYNKHLKFVKPVSRSKKTVASAIAVKNPIDGNKVLRMLYRSSGMALDVSEEQILEAQIELASLESLFTEPSSSTVYAALKKLVLKGRINEKATVVCLLTGTGLKDPSSSLENLSRKLNVANNISGVRKVFKKNKWLI